MSRQPETAAIGTIIQPNELHQQQQQQQRNGASQKQEIRTNSSSSSSITIIFSLVRGPFILTSIVMYYIVLPYVRSLSSEITLAGLVCGLAIVLSCYDTMHYVRAHIKRKSDYYVSRLVHSMKTVSLDDVLKSIYDPVSGLLATISAMVIAPYAMYSVNLTPEQRAMLFEASIRQQQQERHSDDDDNNNMADKNHETAFNIDLHHAFLQPGGWINLLPKKVQHYLGSDDILVKYHHDDNNMDLAPSSSESSLADTSAAAVDDAAAFKKQMYSISPVWRKDGEPAVVDNNNSAEVVGTTNSSSNASTRVPLMIKMHGGMWRYRSAAPTGQQLLEQSYNNNSIALCNKSATALVTKEGTNGVHGEKEITPKTTSLPHELFQSFLAQIIQQKVRGILQARRTKTVSAVTAVSAASLLLTQLRYSRTARRNLRSVAHSITTITTIGALSASTSYLILSYYYNSKKQQQCPTLPPPTANTTTTTTDSQSHQQQQNDTINIIATTGTSSNSKNKLRSYVTKLLLVLAKNSTVTSLSWKGFLAAVVLYYFGNRHNTKRRRLMIQQNHSYRIPSSPPSSRFQLR